MKRAIFVIDMINGFVKEGLMHDEYIMQIVPYIQKALNQVEKKNIFFIADTHEETAIEFKAFPTHCIKGSKESEVIDELKDWVVNPIIEKNSTNAFHVMDKGLLDDYDEFVLVGCCSDICVLQFALSLKTYFNQCNLNKNVIVLKDGIATYQGEGHERDLYHELAINLMRQSGISIE